MGMLRSLAAVLTGICRGLRRRLNDFPSPESRRLHHLFQQPCSARWPVGSQRSRVSRTPGKPAGDRLDRPVRGSGADSHATVALA